MRRILVTAALPYANGSVHIGHLVEYLQVDFWARFQRMMGHECYYVCADDTHGTPVMVEARKRGITPEALVGEMWKQHTQDFHDFQIEFAHYSSTHSQENRRLCEEFFKAMQAAQHIKTQMVEQLYCEHDKMFLPDRFVKGTCPKCSSADQYGDNCDVCGATYAPTDLKDSYCAICRNPPVLKSSEHLLFELENFRDYLKQWLPKHTSKEITNKMMEWFQAPLRAWDISRDAPYFGFEIPGYPGKYFYVWVDAPMGYVSSTKQLCDKLKLNFDEFWRQEDKVEVYHLLGKDILYFHTLFWPAMLKSAGFRTPTAVWAHGRLTINGQKMSKSKGTQIQAREYLDNLDASYLRYYYATKINSSMDDFDWNADDFSKKVNAELIGKITNLASRGAQMLEKKFSSQIGDLDSSGAELVRLAQDQGKVIAAHFDARDFSKGLAEIRSLAEAGNRYFDEHAPWKSAESDPQKTQAVLSATLNLFRCLAIYLKPFLPVYAAKVEALFNEPQYHWQDSQKVLKNHKIQAYQHLLGRIDEKKVKDMMDQSLNKAATLDASSKPAPPSTSESGQIEIGEFSKVDLRIAKILQAEEIKEADKLLRLKVDVGPLGERQIIAGIKAAYKAEELVGRLTVIVANLKPRTMKFGVSEGMVLAAGSGGAELFIMSPDAGAKPGDRVK